MADRELLEAAAKAAGLRLQEKGRKDSVFIVLTNDNGDYIWSPLHDDGDALRLAVKLRFGVTIDSYVGPLGFVRVYVSNSIPAVEEPIEGDAGAATRRAIVRAAAALAPQGVTECPNAPSPFPLDPNTMSEEVKLPPPDIRVTAFGEIEPTNGRSFVMGDFYTADQLRAAVLEERERCAKLCDSIENERWDMYKRGTGPERASDYVQGQSDGACSCAAAIRKG